MPTQEQRSTETKRAINDATIRCLFEDGYAATTTGAVHQRAGVSRGALTHHYSSKQEMMIAAVEHLSLVREREISEAAKVLPLNDERAHAVIELLWGTFKSDLFYAALELWNAARTDSALHEALYRAERRVGVRHRALAAEMFGEPISAHPDFDRALEMMFRQLRGAAVTRLLRRPPEAEDSVVDDLSGLFRTMVAVDIV